MEFKGTKGKWVKFNSRIEQTHGYTTSVICRFEPNMSNQSRYNALLISKAPELLEMLIKCNNMLATTTEHDVLAYYQIVVEEAKELIKQATTL